MREVNGSELLAGSDHEFVVNLYTVILNRWPDEDGYRHHLQRVENRPDIRRQVIQDVAGSAEGRALGVDAALRRRPAAGGRPRAGRPRGRGGDGRRRRCAGGAAGDARHRCPMCELRALHRQLSDALGAVATERAARVEARLARLEQRLG